MHGNHFISMTEPFNSYATHMRQVATSVGYCEPRVLDVFKDTFPTRLYWVLFHIGDLRQIVEKAKRILKKERIDRQLAGQSSLTLFMNIKNFLLVQRLHLTHRVV